MMGKTEHHVQNTKHLIDKLKGIRLQPNEILISHDVVSLFTKIPVKNAIIHIKTC